MWEGFHLCLCESGSLPALNPWPSLHIGNGVLALAESSQVFSLLTSVFAREVDLKNTVYAEGLVLESCNGI